MLIEVIGFILKSYIEVTFLDAFLMKKDCRHHIIFYIHLTLISIIFFFILPFIDYSVVLKTSFSLLILLSFLIYYADKTHVKILYLILLFVIIMISELVTGLILLGNSVPLEVSYFNKVFNTIQIFINDFLLFIFVFIVKIIYKKDVQLNKMALLIIYPLSSIFVLYSLYFIISFEMTKQLTYTIFLVDFVLLLIANFTIIYIVKIIIKGELVSQKNKFSDEYSLVNKQHQDDLVQLYRDIKKNHHDLKATFTHLLGLLYSRSYNDSIILIKRFLKDTEAFESVINTGYDGLDAVLSSKITTAKNNNILIVPVILLPNKALMHIDEIDISIICSNILDNALEAQSQFTPEENSFYFKITYDTILSSLVISCKNRTKLTSSPVQTHKKNKINHGFGLENIKDIAEKWNGMVYYNVSDGYFKIIVTLANKS